MEIAAPESDVWSNWLLQRRHGGDGCYQAALRKLVERYADKVLDGAALAPGMRMLDLGSGEGLVPFKALARFDGALTVTLTDVSLPMLRYAEEQAKALGWWAQCAFLPCPATDLQPLEDARFDAVTSRAVLAYVADKLVALRECYRVLKPGGRLSLAEPIFQDEALVACALRKLVSDPAAPPEDRFLPLLHRWKAALFPDTEAALRANPLTNYTERDLLQLVQAAGFAQPHLELHIDIAPAGLPSWEAFLDSAPHPLTPTHGTVLAERFSLDERAFFEQILRPSIESGQFQSSERIAYLTAIKPGL
ncbi:class I SAM-dependent methyltransferase [Chitinimonas sp.]|uniref:class I SAM-dependent methyltransferase n=1 Tax=Chitinimonas sp. TaxID=1934313 RepID=UPI002F92264F